MRPFEGVKILDCTHVLAGPFTAYQLAVLGADGEHTDAILASVGYSAADRGAACSRRNGLIGGTIAL